MNLKISGTEIFAFFHKYAALKIFKKFNFQFFTTQFI